MWVIQLYLVFKMATVVTCSSDFYADLHVGFSRMIPKQLLGYELVNLATVSSNILSNTIGRLPKWKSLQFPSSGRELRRLDNDTERHSTLMEEHEQRQVGLNVRQLCVSWLVAHASQAFSPAQLLVSIQCRCIRILHVVILLCALRVFTDIYSFFQSFKLFANSTHMGAKFSMTGETHEMFD